MFCGEWNFEYKYAYFSIQLCAQQRWNWNIIILTKFSSLAAPNIVKMTTFGAASDENIVKMMTFPFQWRV